MTLPLMGAGPSSPAAAVFDPLSLSPSVWLKADAITGKADGDAISSWTDSSGNGKHAVQATGGLQPLYKTNILNSLPSVRFDASDDRLVTTVAVAQSNTVFVVGKTSDANDGFYFDGKDATDRQLFESANDAAQYKFYAGSSVISTGVAIDTDPHVYTLKFAGASSEFWLDGTSVSTGNPGASGVAGYTLGKAYEGSGSTTIDLFEFFVCGALSASDRQAMEGYLAAKYAL